MSSIYSRSVLLAVVYILLLTLPTEAHPSSRYCGKKLYKQLISVCKTFKTPPSYATETHSSGKGLHHHCCHHPCSIEYLSTYCEE